jgi:hypothetical protein
MTSGRAPLRLGWRASRRASPASVAISPHWSLRRRREPSSDFGRLCGAPSIELEALGFTRAESCLVLVRAEVRGGTRNSSCGGRMRSSFWSVWMAAGMGIAGCGGTDSSPVDAPEQQCESLASTWCQQSIDCLVTVGTIPEKEHLSSREQCTDIAVATIQCNMAVSIGEAYEQCLSDIRAMECAVWEVPSGDLGAVSPPTTCRGVVVLSQQSRESRDLGPAR